MLNVLRRISRRLDWLLEEWEMRPRIALALLPVLPFVAAMGGVSMLGGKNDRWAGPLFIGGSVLTGVYWLTPFMIVAASGG